MRLKIAGGCGEHGRNCFYVETENSAFLVDCGLMAEEVAKNKGGYPRLTIEDIANIKYVFLTHSHADHTGALPWLFEKGFNGKVIATKETLEQLPFTIEKKISLEEFCNKRKGKIDNIAIEYGRSGHCVGSVWYQFESDGKVIFFSGDYVEKNFVHEIDLVQNKVADFAVLDCAYGYDTKSFKNYCEDLIVQVINLKKIYPSLLFSVPKYGRGLELYWLLKNKFPYWSFQGDEHFLKVLQESENNIWIKNEVQLSNDVTLFSNSVTADIVFVSDPQLRSQNARKITNQVLLSGHAIMTGTVEKGTMSEQLIEEGKMSMLRFPVHLNYTHFLVLVEKNCFKKTIAYHSKEIDCEREIFI